MAEKRAESQRTEVYDKIQKNVEEQNKTKQRKKNRNTSDKTAQITELSSASKSAWDKIESANVPQNKTTQQQIDELKNEVMKKIATPRRNRWDVVPGETPLSARQGGETPTPNKWFGATPMRTEGVTPSKTPGKTKWDELPSSISGSTTPNFNASTPKNPNLMTPTTEISSSKFLLMREDDRNKPMTDEELNQILPSNGYEIVKPPENYQPIRQQDKKLTSTPVQESNQQYYKIPESNSTINAELQQTPKDPNSMPFIKPEEIGYFSALLSEVDEDNLSPEEQRDRKIMMLLLKIKNGTPPMRKASLRQIAEKSREFGAGPLFNQILPLMMSPTLEDQERHLLVKVIDRILFKLDDLVRPFVHKILVVIEPMLIDEDYYARVEGREIISNLSKAAGLATMISTLRPDIDHKDEYVRNTTARAFAVVASALGIPALLPFLKAVCQSKKSWQAAHTGIKIVQQISILMGYAVLPHLKSLVEIIEHGLRDDQQKVRTITALAIAALAESSYPYGIEAFQNVLVPLCEGITIYEGKGLAAFLKAIGYIIPLMDSTHAGYYTNEVMNILIREFRNPEDEMIKIVLSCVKQCVATEGVSAKYIKEIVVPEFFKHFWSKRNVYDKRNSKILIDTTVQIAQKIGGAEVIQKIVYGLKDDSEQYRKIVVETIEKVFASLGVSDVDNQLEEEIIDGIYVAFYNQASDETNVMLNGFGTIVNCLGVRVKPYIHQIFFLIHNRLNDRSANARMQAADLIARVAASMKVCGEESILGRLGVILYQYLGEEYPEVLGSILGALKAIVSVIGMTKMTPPIKDLLPRLTPILKNRHEKVQENCIDLIGRIADKGSEYVSAREWMRICFDLLDMLKAHKKSIRRATVNTFGFIAKAIGPQDVLTTLLSNLKVQERQNRVCTTVAIAIVSETCGPFTVLPALMNEYRVPEMNVQNGVLKSLSFMFEYIGEMARDYVYSLIPLLEDGLMDRDLVHRQTASMATKHLALGVAGLGCEDAICHLLNFIFPNIFEISPHVINAVLEGIEGCRVALGAPRVLLYIMQGLFHPARRVREVYWKIYNNMYIGSADSMVSAFPNFEDFQGCKYRRWDLELNI